MGLSRKENLKLELVARDLRLLIKDAQRVLSQAEKSLSLTEEVLSLQEKCLQGTNQKQNLGWLDSWDKYLTVSDVSRQKIRDFLTGKDSELRLSRSLQDIGTNDRLAILVEIQKRGFGSRRRRNLMSFTQAGSCPHCGAPIYVPMAWWGITPPPPQYTCSCMAGRSPQIRVSDSTANQEHERQAHTKADCGFLF